MKRGMRVYSISIPGEKEKKSQIISESEREQEKIVAWLQERGAHIKKIKRKILKGVVKATLFVNVMIYYEGEADIGEAIVIDMKKRGIFPDKFRFE